MRHRIAIYCPENRRSEDGFYRYSYSDRLHLETHYPSAAVFGSIQDAAELQRLNPQHEIKIYYASNRAEVPLWFMKKYAHYEDKPSQLAQAWYYENQINNNMYEPSHPIVDQAPAFIYQPSDKFLIKKALYGMDRRNWTPILGVTREKLARTWASIFKEQMNGKTT